MTVVYKHSYLWGGFVHSDSMTPKAKWNPCAKGMDWSVVSYHGHKLMIVNLGYWEAATKIFLVNPKILPTDIGKIWNRHETLQLEDAASWYKSCGILELSFRLKWWYWYVWWKVIFLSFESQKCSVFCTYIDGVPFTQFKLLHIFTLNSHISCSCFYLCLWVHACVHVCVHVSVCVNKPRENLYYQLIRFLCMKYMYMSFKVQVDFTLSCNSEILSE